MQATQYKALGVADAAQVLFPRSRVETCAYLSEKMHPLYLFDGSRRRPPMPEESECETHYEFFKTDRESRWKRGRVVRSRIDECLRLSGRLDETHRDGESLARVLRTAMYKSREYGMSQFVSPGLVEAPNGELANEYAKRGRSRVLWSSFRPSYLKVTFDKRWHTWRLEVVDVKSTQPRAIRGASFYQENEIFGSEKFKLQTYRYFLRLLVLRIASSEDPFLKRLVVSRTLTIWRYTGCYSRQCRYTSPPCLLNRIYRPSIGNLEEEFQVLSKADNRWIERQLLIRVPRELGLKNCTPFGSDSGYSGR